MKDTEILKQKNNMKFLFKLLFTVSILYSAEAYSWGIIGHRTIAEIAENHISNNVYHCRQKNSAFPLSEFGNRPT